MLGTENITIIQISTKFKHVKQYIYNRLSQVIQSTIKYIYTSTPQLGQG